MKYSLLSLFFVTSFATYHLQAMELKKTVRLVNWTETTEGSIRTITCQVNDAEYFGVKGFIEVHKQICIITNKLVRLEGTITLATGVAFAIQPTNISTCFDQISALRLIDLRNEERQRLEKEKYEAAKQVINEKKYVNKARWRKADEFSSIDK